MNRDFLTGAAIALALHAWVLLGVPAWFVAHPRPVGPPEFVVSLVEPEPPSLAPAAPTPPEPATPLPPPRPIPLPELAPEPRPMVIATTAPAASPAPAPTATASPRLTMRPRAARPSEATTLAAPGGGSGGASSEARPRYRTNPPPNYPTEARRLRQQGQVLLEVDVSAEGRATSVRVKRSSGVPSLDEAALRAVRRWTFEPARRAGVALASRVEVPVQFALGR